MYVLCKKPEKFNENSIKSKGREKCQSPVPRSKFAHL